MEQGSLAIASELIWWPQRDVMPVEVVDLNEWPDYLQECGLLSWQFAPVAGCLGLLLDLRGALQISVATVGVLVARNVKRFEWTTYHNEAPPRWYSIVGLTVGSRSHFSVSLGFESGAELAIDSDAAELYTGRAPISEGPPPDFGEYPIEQIQALLPGWDTEFTVDSVVALTTTR